MEREAKPQIASIHETFRTVNIVQILIAIRLQFLQQLSMLPQLTKKRSDKITQGRNSKAGTPLEDSRNGSKVKSMSAKKIRSGGGFMKSNVVDDTIERPTQTQQFIQQQSHIKYAKFKRSEDLSAEIKLIEKKIKACQKKMQSDRKREKMQDEEAAKPKDGPHYDFQKVVRRQMQLQGYHTINQENQQNFDYLTNPKLKGPEEEVQAEEAPVQEKPLVVQAKPYNIQAGVQKLERFYENSLKKKFERRQVFPHQPCKRKTPKLYITQKTNALSKYGRAQNSSEHMFRVLTKQITPQEIYPTIPNFPVVKDSLSKNIVAYLGDYKPFIDKTKQSESQRRSKDEAKDEQYESQSQSENQNKSMNQSNGNRKAFNFVDSKKDENV